MRGRSRLAVAAVVATATSILGGCGQKGPLYLPEKKGGAVVSAPAQAPQPPASQGQPPQTAPAPEPQSISEPPPTDTAAPAKKPDKDNDQQNPQ